MRRTLPLPLRRLRGVVVAAAALLAVDGVSLAVPAGAGTPPLLTQTSTASPSVGTIFVLGGAVAVLGLAAVVLGVRRGRRRR